MEMTQNELAYTATLIEALKWLDSIDADLSVDAKIYDSNGDLMGTVTTCDWGEYGFKPNTPSLSEVPSDG